MDKGAEAIIIREGKHVVKNRVAKGYRIKEIDEKLRGFRTRREAKILEKLKDNNFPAPRLNDLNDKKMTIRMDYLDGKKLRDVLEKKDTLKLAKEIGKKVAMLHNLGIIHSDLTTSNMILMNEIYFIDFGLSFFSDKVEDKAVDLHLLRQALESKHYKVYEECFRVVLEGYKEAKEYDAVLKRLEQVEKRGRYKH